MFHFFCANKNMIFIIFKFYCSCVTWSSYHKNVLASSDYEGTITLWDAFTGQKSKLFQVGTQVGNIYHIASILVQFMSMFLVLKCAI